jgi:hypothetical protein
VILMRKLTYLLICLILPAALAIPSTITLADDIMVFTANQEFLSRIYVMDTTGAVIDYHEYDFYRWVGMEVVEGELYVAEAFAPRVYKVDPMTGDLEVFIDDWLLYYFYDVAFDGTYFYVDEWDLNRYDINGDYAGTAGFDEDVLGMAWDGEYLWTLDDTDLVKCWDLSGWPTVTQVPDNNFTPPSPQCRGLYFDGEYFWSAESGDSPGLIYKFDYSGKMIEQWSEPAFSGWGAAFIEDPLTGISREESPAHFAFGLKGNHPNPFNPITNIRFSLPNTGFTELSIYDVTGKKIVTLISKSMEEGEYEIPWRAAGLASGVYLAQLKSSGRVDTHKLILLK